MAFARKLSSIGMAIPTKTAYCGSCRVGSENPTVETAERRAIKHFLHLIARGIFIALVILLLLFLIGTMIAIRSGSIGRAFQFLALSAAVTVALFVVRKLKAKVHLDDRPSTVQSKNWITVSAISRVRRAEKSEAQLTLHTKTGMISKKVKPRRSVGANDAPSFKATFGFEKSERSASIEIVWPSGLIEVFPNQGINQDVVLNEGMGERK